MIGMGALVVAGALLAGCAGAPQPQATAELPPVADPVTRDELVDYGGVAVTDFGSQCTASLIETGVDEGPAYVITNGHCVGLDGAPSNSAVVDEEAYGDATFFQTADDGERLTVPATRVEYATMRATDVAIVRLDATLGDLRAAGAVPRAIAASAPAEGTDVVNIAAPTQGLVEGEWVLRRGECTVGAPGDIIEFRWLWLDTQPNDCPGVRGGSSGSPLIAGNEIVSLINTTNTGVPVERGDTCYLGKPCEIDGNAAVFVPDTSYGVSVAGIGACFVDGVFTLDGPCGLVVPALGDSEGGGIYGPDGTDGGGWQPELRLRSDTDVEVAVVTNVPLGDAARCTDAAAYADAPRYTVEGLAEEPVTIAVDDLPVENGFVLACAAVPGDEDGAIRFVFSIDAVPPTSGPELSVESLGDDEIMVDPLFDIPDIADIHVLYGEPDATDCANRDAYRPYIRQAFFIPNEELPVRFCAVGFDMAGNESPVTDQIID